MYNQYKQLDFVIDDDKYFGLTSFKMSGNRNYYSSDHDQTPIPVATYSKKKLEPKIHVMDSDFPQRTFDPGYSFRP